MPISILSLISPVSSTARESRARQSAKHDHDHSPDQTSISRPNCTLVLFVHPTQRTGLTPLPWTDEIRAHSDPCMRQEHRPGIVIHLNRQGGLLSVFFFFFFSLLFRLPRAHCFTPTHPTRRRGNSARFMSACRGICIWWDRCVNRLECDATGRRLSALDAGPGSKSGGVVVGIVHTWYHGSQKCSILTQNLLDDSAFCSH